MAEKLTIEFVRNVFLERGYLLQDTIYINNSSKLTAISKDGYKIYVSYASFVRNKEPAKFFYGNIYTYDNICLFLSKNIPHVKLITKDMRTANTKMEWECEKHNYKWSAKWGSIYYGSSCPVCGGTKRYSLEELKEMIVSINNDIEIIDDNYTNIYTDLKCRCRKHNIVFYKKWSLLCDGIGCECCIYEKRSKNSYFKGKCLKGEDSPSWKGGITPLHNHLRYKIEPWKIDSFKKYNFKCDITNKSNRLVIHHVHNFSDILIETVNSLNMKVLKDISVYSKEELKIIEEKCLELHYKYGLGICLTEALHNEFHSIYGKRNNTLKQYLEFKENKLKEMGRHNG